jgi:vitamin B12 transporter
MYRAIEVILAWRRSKGGRRTEIPRRAPWHEPRETHVHNHHFHWGLLGAGRIAAAMIALAAGAAAQAEEDSDTIVVTAARSEQPIAEVGQSITVIDLQTIAQRQTLSLPDLLRTTPGITVIRNGGVGSQTSIAIRGASSDQTVALIDGVKLNDPASTGGGYDFADLLTDNVERIEILRGPQSVLWGSQAIGGVVNIISRTPTDTLSASLRGEYGYRDTGHVTGNASGKMGPVSASVGATWLRTDGISTFDEHLGGTERDGYHVFATNAKLGVAIADGVSLDLRGFYSKSRADLDGFPPPAFSFADTGEYNRTEQFVGYAGLNAALFDGRLKNRIAFAYTNVDRDSFDPASVPASTFTGRGRNRRFEYQGVAEIADAIHATFGAEHEESRYRTTSIFSFPAGLVSHAKVNIDSVYGQVTVTPITGLSAGAGLRYDDHSQFGDATTLSANAVYSPNAGATTLRASYGEGFKAPSLYQLYGDFGTPTLTPEKAKGWDAGIAQKLLEGAVELSATWFERRTRNQIDFDLSSFIYANIARARARGVELAVRMTPAEHFTVTANYTYSDAENRARADPNFGKPLTRRPKNSVSASADYAWDFGLSAGATITGVSNSFDDAGNSQRLEGYTLVDLRAAFAVMEKVEIFGRIENLFGERYETAFQYGSPGRAAYVGARVRY